MRKTLLLAFTAAALTAASTTPAAAQTPPSAADLCALATADTVEALRATPELARLIPASLPSDELVALGARFKLGCGGDTPSPAEAKVRVCAALTVSGVTALADRLDATAGVKSNITPANVAAARRAVACTDGPTPVGGGTSTPTPTATPTPAPPAGFVDLDCADFPNQTAAQAKLDETPGADPHRLDADNDRLACEVDETENSTDPTPAADTDGGGFTQVGADDVPVGGVDTGA